MANPDSNGKYTESKTSEDQIKEEAVLHAIAASTSTIQNNLLKEDFRVETDCVAFGVVDREVLVWYC